MNELDELVARAEGIRVAACELRDKLKVSFLCYTDGTCSAYKAVSAELEAAHKERDALRAAARDLADAVSNYDHGLERWDSLLRKAQLCDAVLDSKTHAEPVAAPVETPEPVTARDRSHEAVIKERDELKDELEAVRSEHYNELDALRYKVETVRHERDDLKVNVQTVLRELAATKQELGSLKDMNAAITSQLVAETADANKWCGLHGKVSIELDEQKKKTDELEGMLSRSRSCFRALRAAMLLGDVVMTDAALGWLQTYLQVKVDDNG